MEWFGRLLFVKIKIFVIEQFSTKIVQNKRLQKQREMIES